MTDTYTNARPLHAIAGQALADPTLKGNARTYALPYLRALTTLTSTSDTYGADTGDMITRYALSNLTAWRGASARTVKTELRAHLAAHGA